jgi:hypothetical protein
MEFCLFYEGELPSNGNKEDKHRIRLEIEPQLKKLWEQEPLRGLWIKKERDGSSNNELIKSVDSRPFLPIVTSQLHLYAEINIEMIRPGKPGDLVQGGDIDNRLKTLFDALRMPNEVNELVEASEDNESPCHCLLEDDCLITRA